MKSRRRNESVSRSGHHKITRMLRRGYRQTRRYAKRTDYSFVQPLGGGCE